MNACCLIQDELIEHPIKKALHFWRADKDYGSKPPFVYKTIAFGSSQEDWPKLFDEETLMQEIRDQPIALTFYLGPSFSSWRRWVIKNNPFYHIYFSIIK